MKFLKIYKLMVIFIPAKLFYFFIVIKWDYPKKLLKGYICLHREGGGPIPPASIFLGLYKFIKFIYSVK